MGEPPVWEGQGGSWHSARRPSAFFTLRRDSSFLRVRKTCRAWSTETLRAQACRFDGPSEVNGDAEGSPSAIQRLARIVQADVVDLRTQIDARKYADIHAAANAESKLVRGESPAAETRATDQALHERIDFRGVAKSQARAKHIRVCIQGNSARRGVIGAEITSNTEPAVGVKGDGAADPVLVDAVGVAQAEVGIASGNVHGLRVRRN